MTITDIINESRGLVDATATSYACAATTDLLFIRINNSYEEIIGDLIAIDKRWKFDDSNYTTLPIGTGDLEAGTNDYAFSTALLGIERIEVIDNEGNITKLKSIEERRVSESLDEYEDEDGLPKEYAIRGNSIFLYPTPSAADVTLEEGLIVYFRRTADIYTIAQVVTGTKVPGFASPYHTLISHKAALPYARSYKKDRVVSIEREIERLHTKLMAHYNNQNKDKLNEMTPFIEDNR